MRLVVHGTGGTLGYLLLTEMTTTFYEFSKELSKDSTATLIPLYKLLIQRPTLTYKCFKLKCMLVETKYSRNSVAQTTPVLN